MALIGVGSGGNQTGKSACEDLLKGLEMAPMQGDVVRESDGRNTYFRWGKQWCACDADGVAIAAADLTQMRATGGAPMLKGETDVLEFARARAKAVGRPFLPEEDLSPQAPWSLDTNIVVVTSRGRAYGYSTFGYAGGTRMQINRLTGKVASFAWSPEFKVDKPNEKITKTQAIGFANPLLKAYRKTGESFSTAAVRQFFRPREATATDEGKRMLRERRLRLCWMVTLVRGAIGETAPPVAAVAIDIETGKALSVPLTYQTGSAQR